MAKKSVDTPKKTKEPGRIKQIWQIFVMTMKYNKINILYFALAILLPAIAATLLIIFTNSDWLGIILWTLTAVMGALLLFLAVLNNRAQDMAYRQYEGQPGAVGMVLKNLGGSWRASEMPIQVNKNQDMVYRAVGKSGIVLVGEGQSSSRVEKLLKDEERKIVRILPKVVVENFVIGQEEGQTRLFKLPKAIKKLPKTLKRVEIAAVHNRLDSLSAHGPVPIPKGIDPMKVRSQRPR